ncbi:hypothetical protein B0T25DRAFT_531085 [Lasiosphaeria hispida]|nr:hypothetical protein B0T25DRAFT_531085 [Lasiosphaeria hispida]
MDGTEDAQRKKDRSSGSASASVASRGVSTSNPSAADHQNPSSAERRRGSRSPRSSPPVSYLPRRQSGSSDGADDQTSKGKGLMAGQHSWASRAQSPALGGETSLPFDNDPTLSGSARGAGSADSDYTASRYFSRPPPPPPLTPPTLSSAVFPFQDRRHSYAISIPPELDTSFIHQPNPDYMGDSTSTDVAGQSPRSAVSTPRRRSYTKSVPVGVPIPGATSASSSAETMTSAGTFSPSSYPPTSPMLPPPPPGQDFPYEYEFVGGPGGPGIAESYQEIDLHGEIISVMDDAGHGWKRHTRVYGGGVCLACVAAGEEGGFYGDKVPLADRR